MVFSKTTSSNGADRPKGRPTLQGPADGEPARAHAPGLGGRKETPPWPAGRAAPSTGAMGRTHRPRSKRRLGPLRPGRRRARWQSHPHAAFAVPTKCAFRLGNVSFERRLGDLWSFTPTGCVTASYSRSLARPQRGSWPRVTEARTRGGDTATHEVKLQIQPKVTFKQGKAVKTSLNWGKIEAPKLRQHGRCGLPPRRTTPRRVAKPGRGRPSTSSFTRGAWS